MDLPDRLDWTVGVRVLPAHKVEIISSTSGIFKTDVPYPVTIDLPVLTARRRAVLEAARPE